MSGSGAHRNLLGTSIAFGLVLASCASPRSRPESGNSPQGLASLLLPKAENKTDDPSSLQKIADADYAQLPAIYRAEPVDFSDEAEDEGGSAGHDHWKRPGLNPGEVHPGDIFVERDGVKLHKIFSLLDGLDEDSRASELGRIASTALERMPVTLSRSEILEIESKLQADVPLPTRSVALDVRTATHTLDPDRFETAIAELEKGRKGDERQERLRSQLRDVKSRLGKGEALQLVTAVTESDSIDATYPGAPVGKRDAEPVRNAILGSFPHLDEIEAEKVDSKIVVSGNPRLVWEFDSRPLLMDRNRFALASNATHPR